MRARGATHSFRLTAQACDYVENLGDGRSKWKKGKSRWVSDAIVWFFSSPVYANEYDDQGERTGKLVRAGKGTPSPVMLVEEIERLRARCQALEEEKVEKKAPPPTWWRRFWRSG